MLVLWCTLNRSLPATAQCAKVAEQKSQRLAEVGLREITERSFDAYVEPLENGTAFKYL